MLAEVRTWFQPWYYKFGAIVLSAALGLCGYEWVNWSRLSASDWGTWIGAIGTVATLIGTIWIATSETRRQNKQAIDRAYVAAASLETRIIKVESVVICTLKYLQRSSVYFGVHDYAKLALKLKQTDSWTDEEILPLIALPGHCSVRMVVIRAQITALARKMDSMDENKRFNPSTEDERGHHQELIADLKNCQNSAAFVLDALSKFSAEMAAR